MIVGINLPEQITYCKIDEQHNVKVYVLLRIKKNKLEEQRRIEYNSNSTTR